MFTDQAALAASPRLSCLMLLQWGDVGRCPRGCLRAVAAGVACSDVANSQRLDKGGEPACLGEQPPEGSVEQRRLLGEGPLHPLRNQPLALRHSNSHSVTPGTAL